MQKPDLIDRKALLKALRKEKRECEKDGEEFGGESILYAEAFDDAIDMVKNQPAVDAVTVVRCKDCKKYSKRESKLGFRWCDKWDNVTRDMDFCSSGERRRTDYAAD